jgi:hypothetical protein
MKHLCGTRDDGSQSRVRWRLCWRSGVQVSTRLPGVGVQLQFRGGAQEVTKVPARGGQYSEML